MAELRPNSLPNNDTTKHHFGSVFLAFPLFPFRQLAQIKIGDFSWKSRRFELLLGLDSSERVQQDLLFLGSLPKLRQCPSFDLPNPFLGHTQRGADFFKRLRLLCMIQAEPTGNNLLLAFVQPAKDPL